MSVGGIEDAILAYDEWDRQMAADFSPGGRGMALVKKVQLEIATGRSESLLEGLARVKAQREGVRE